MDKNKALKIAGIVAVIVVLIVFASLVGEKSSGDNKIPTELSNDAEVILANAQKESAEVKDSEKKEFKQIDVAKYLEYYEGSEPQIILLARPTCTYCQIATPIIQNVMFEYDIEVNYLNTDNFTDETQTQFVKSDEFFSSGYGTPVLFVVKDSAIISKVDGMTDRAHYIEFFKENGFIEQ